MPHPSSTHPLAPLKPVQIFCEVVFIVVVALFATSPFLDLGQNTRLGGIESEYLTRTAYSVSTILPEKGYFPLWQSYLERGDPLLENPVSFALNPLASIPPYLFGLYDGVKISLLLAVICAGVGGWALGRVLGLGSVARLLLACLLIGKGNFHAYLVEGHFPLVIVQAFFPWVFTGVVAIFKGHRRWSVGLLTVSFVFVFWSGIPWYPPAILLSIGILSLFGMVDRLPDSWHLRVRWLNVGGVLLGIVATFFLSAALMYPLLTKGDNIGETPILEDYRADLIGTVGSFFASEKNYFDSGYYPQGFAYSYYNYMSPGWYALLVAGLLLLVVIVQRKRLVADTRFVWGFLALFLFTLLWGAGQNPIIELFYRTIPYASQFRHVERVFAVTSSALIVLLAMGVDVVWRYLVQTPIWSQHTWVASGGRRVAVRVSLGGALVLLSGVAGYDVVRQWDVSWGEHFTQPEDEMENACITWLRQTYPDEQLSVFTLGYKNIYTYLRNQVRHAWVASDFYHAEGLPSTVFNGTMQRPEIPPTELLPEFAMGITHYDDSWLAERGYVPIEASINPYTDGRPCLYQREGAFSYAWSTTQAQLDRYTDLFSVAETTPITTFIRDYDRISVLAQARPDEDVVVTVSEVAYPGWKAFLNGEPVPLESLGGQIAVVLPRSDQFYTVLFRYLPDRFFLGSRITLATAGAIILYLLYVDRTLIRLLNRRKTVADPQSELPLAQMGRQLIQQLDPLKHAEPALEESAKGQIDSAPPDEDR